MKYYILNEKGEKMNEFNEKSAILKLLEILWSKQVTKSKWITKQRFNYNYTDRQKITFYTDNKWQYVFEDIPTSWGALDISKLEVLKDGM